MPTEFIEYQGKDYHLIINPSNVGTVKLTQEDYFEFKQLISYLQNRDNNDVNTTRESLNEDLLKKLVREHVIELYQVNESTVNSEKMEHRDAYLGLTDACNFRCIYCYAECGPEKFERVASKLEYEDYCYIIDEIVNLGYRSLYLTGGEPLLNPHVFKIARYAKGKGIFCGILTNGSLVNENNVKKFNVFDLVKISLDSEIEEINDLTRGKGTCIKIIRGLKLLKEEGITLGINTVLSQYNKDVLASVIKYIDNELGVVEHTVANHVSCGRGTLDMCEIPEAELEYYSKVTIRERSKIYAASQKAFMRNSKRHNCGMACGDVFINCEGKVYPCRMAYSDEFYLGDIFEIGLKRALRNFDFYRKLIDVDSMEKCKDCNVRYLCGGGCRMLHYSKTSAIDKTSDAICKRLRCDMKYRLLYEHNMYDENEIADS